MKTTIQISGNDKTIPTYMVTPETNKKNVAIILIHEVWGLNDHIKSVSDRFASEGYTVLAPDLLKGTELEPLITPELVADMSDPDKRAARQVELRKIMAPLSSPEFSEAVISKLQICFDYAQNLQEIDKVAVLGFCFGGTYSYGLAVRQPGLAAAVPFYGHCDYTVEDLEKINCPVLAFYGENDQNLVENLPKVESNMEKAHVDFTYKVYPNTGHAFFNDTNPITYNKNAANDSWEMTLGFLKDKIS